MTDIARERSLLAAEGLDIATRETWGAAQDYRSARSVVEPAAGFALHIAVIVDHGDLTGTEHADMRTIERIGTQRFGAEVGFPYNAAVFDTARLYEGQPLTRRGAHTVDDKAVGYPSMGTSRSMNFHWRAIVLPQMVDDDVTDGQVDQCARWAAAQVRVGLARRDYLWIGHRDVAWKSCPGDTGYARLPEIRQLTEHYATVGLGPTPEEDTLSAEEVKAITDAVDRVRPFIAQAPDDAAVWLITRDGTKRWVSSQAMLAAVVKDGARFASKAADGTPLAYARSRGHLAALETVGPVPAGW